MTYPCNVRVSIVADNTVPTAAVAGTLSYPDDTGAGVLVPDEPMTLGPDTMVTIPPDGDPGYVAGPDGDQFENVRISVIFLGYQVQVVAP